MAEVPLLLGHRGARRIKSAPENTLAAFDLALAEGCDGFEFDVRLSGDGEAVICHDAEVITKKVASSSAAALGVPLLLDVLQRYQSRAFLDIELKVPGLEELTTELLRKHPSHRGCVVSSFLPEVLEEIHRIDEAIPLGLICETKSQMSEWCNLPVQYLISHHELVRQQLVAELKEAGRKLVVWTLNSASDIRRFSEWGVDGIISDNPADLVRIAHSNARVKE
jgi:glycerophosphoryl diester phosphodiesterase